MFVRIRTAAGWSMVNVEDVSHVIGTEDKKAEIHFVSSQDPLETEDSMNVVMKKLEGGEDE